MEKISYSEKPSNYDFLLKLRKNPNVKLQPCKYLRDTVVLRNYQAIGAVHFICLNRMILGDGAGLGKCVSVDTRLQTSKGLIRIGDLLPIEPIEDTIYPLSKNFQILSVEGPRESNFIYYSGKKEGLNLLTLRGYEISGLKHHPILTLSKDGYIFKKLEDFSEGDIVCINRKGIFSETYKKIDCAYNKRRCNAKEYRIPEYLDENMAELLGYYISEGHSCRPQTICITQVDSEINKRIRDLLYVCFGYKQNECKNYYEEVIINSVEICKIFEKLGVILTDKSGDKQIPEAIFQSPKSVIASFLRGYFEGDGSIPNDSSAELGCSSKSELLLKQIQTLLLNFGIYSTKRLKNIKVKNERRPYWYLAFHGKPVSIFAKEIGFVSSRKNRVLQEKINISKRNTNIDLIPKEYARNILKSMLKEINTVLKDRAGVKRFHQKGQGFKGIVGETFKHRIEEIIYRKTKTLSYDFLESIIDVLENNSLTQIESYSLLKDLLDKNIFFDKIKSIRVELNEYADLHVPETHNFTGNGFINHNTLQAIAGYSYSLQKDPTLKLLIATPKSAIDQWKEEFEKFTTGITVHVLENTYGKVRDQEIYGDVKELREKGYKVDVLRGYDARQAQYKTVTAQVLITAYYPIEQDYTFLIENRLPNYMFITDECQAFKSRPTQAYFGANKISEQAKKVYGLSATLIKNKLDEAYTIYRIIVPGLFGGVTKFNNEFAVQKLEEIKMAGGKKRKIKKIVGYKNLDKFRERISPYILIRKTKDVASELPSIISKKLLLEMTDEQDRLYKEALDGSIYRREISRKYFEMCDYVKNNPNPTQKDLENLDILKNRYEVSLTEDGIYSSKMAALSYCQLVSNGPGWLTGYEGESSKEIEFKRLFEEELFTEKVIVFTRFKSGIPRLEKILDDLKIKHCKITGDVSKDDRTKARLDFVDTNKDINTIFITQAGSAALNLQAANIMLFYDTPWSYGDLYQIIGRAQRIGSIHPNIHVMHMINKKTIDQKVLTILGSKKELISNVMGDIAEGAIEFGGAKLETDTLFKEDESSIDALFESVFADVLRQE